MGLNERAHILACTGLALASGRRVLAHDADLVLEPTGVQERCPAFEGERDPMRPVPSTIQMTLKRKSTLSERGVSESLTLAPLPIVHGSAVGGLKKVALSPEPTTCPSGKCIEAPSWTLILTPTWARVPIAPRTAPRAVHWAFILNLIWSGTAMSGITVMVGNIDLPPSACIWRVSWRVLDLRRGDA